MLSTDEYPDVTVTVAHPFSDIEVPLEEWIRQGPGPRPNVTIKAARRRSTGAPVALDEIPLEYRNTRESRTLQRRGLLPGPWGPPPSHEPSEPRSGSDSAEAG
jgi:hypothetical protein